MRFKSTGAEITLPDGSKAIELSIIDGQYAGCTFYYESMKMADEENSDGSMNMTFEYQITNDFTPKNKVDFEHYLGDGILEILEEMIANKRDDVVFAGGV